MPSPIGHALAGVSVAWAGDAIDRRRSSLRLVAICAVLATIADLDLLLPRYHRSITHSLFAVVFVLIISAAVTRGVTRWRIALLCTGAYASHLLLDWLGADTLPPFGIQILWPFVDRYFVSGLDLFAETERRHPFSGGTLYQNLWAAGQEVAIIAPVAIALWLIRVKALARLPAEMARRNHAAQ
jgi:membrane-bound metal-dependent hydrolase YbcI (DUF457 family)